MRNGVVFRNGEKLDEPYVIHNSDEGPNDYRDNFPAVPPSDYNRLFPDWQQNFCRNTSKGKTWWCQLTVISPWAITAM